MNSLFGIETEYGIAVEGADAGELVAASREVVKAYAGRYAGPWNYRAEDPRNDMRGFHVDKLAQDPTDAQFESPDKAPRPPKIAATASCSTARVFITITAIPNTRRPNAPSLRSLVAHDKAGERIVLDCARAYSATIGKSVEIFKNNTDFHGASLRHARKLSDAPRRAVGKRGARTSRHFWRRALFTRARAKSAAKSAAWRRCNYQISQRADFFSVLQSVDTLHNRPLVNTRDEAARRCAPFSPSARHRGRRQHERIRHSVARRRDEPGGGADRNWLANAGGAARSGASHQSKFRAIETYRWMVETDDGDTDQRD